MTQDKPAEKAPITQPAPSRPGRRRGPLADGGDYITMPKWMLLGLPTPARVAPEEKK